MSSGNKRRKKRLPKGLLIAVAVFLIADIGLAAYFLLVHKKTVTPAERLESYYSLLDKGKYEELYDYLSSSAKEVWSKEDFITRNQNIYEGIEASDIKITLQDIPDIHKRDIDTVTAEYQTAMKSVAGEISFYNTATLTKTDGEYYIDWNSKLIFNELEDSYKIRVKTTSARRGNIYDRNGTALATTGPVSSVGLIPGKMGDDKAAVITAVSQVLDMTAEEIQKKLDASWVKDDSFVPLREIAKTDAEKEQALLVIPGVMVSTAEDRIYPLGAQAGHLTGYVQSINAEELEARSGQGYNSTSVIGKSGLEKAYEEELRARDGVDIIILNANGDKVGIAAQKAAQDGKDVTVTIDAALQQSAYQAFEVDEGSTVLMNPVSGEVLALVSIPGYDPNEFILGISDRRWEELNSSTSEPLTNRYNASWVPGSTFKPVIASIGLDAGTLDPNENLGNVGKSWQKDSSWGNYFVTTLTDYGPQVDLGNALTFSDNIYFARAALDIGAESIISGLKKFGFDETLPFDLKLQVSTFGDDDKIENEIQLADTGYGQGKVLVNPIHLASMYSAFVNQGNMILPVLKSGQTPSYWKESVITPGTANLIQTDLYQVIDNPEATGAAAHIDGLQLFGKTGTAETKSSQDDAGATEYGWLAISTSADTPDPLLAVSMVEDIQSKEVHGYVNQKIREIFSGYYQSR